MSRIFEITAKDETAKAFEKWEEPAGEDLDLIEETRRAVAQLSQRERFERAKIHLEHALKYKNPRIDIFNQSQSLPYKIAYTIQTAFIWQLIIQILSFVYMYLIVFANGSNEYLYTAGSAYALGIFWIDLLLELLHSSRDGVRKSSRYPMLVYVKAIILTLLVVEEILVAQQVSNSEGRPLNPLRVLRAILPLVYVSEVRRSFQALLSAYEEFLVFVVFDFLVVVGFALIGSIIIQVPQDTVFDEFTSNYDDLGHMIFITYVTGSYDAFPDNQMVAFSISKWFEAFFIVFVFLNMFLFSSIPGSLLFDSYISTRSKYILIDEIKMQHSLILAFISLGEHNYEINIKTIISFFHFLYQDRVRYIDAITELCIKLNDDGNCSVHVLQFIQLGRVLQENPYLKPPLLPDIPFWISFRSKFNSIIPLKRWLSMKPLPLFLALLALCSCINSLICLYVDSETANSINSALSYLLLFDVVIRVIGEGPQNYFNGEWNSLDFSLIMLSLLFNCLSSSSTYSSLFKVFRSYRIFPLMKEVLQNQCLWIEFDLLQKFKKLLGTVIIILPLIARFFPLFIVVYYILGVAGLQIFYDIARDTPSETYSAYDEFSHFKQFLNTQFYLVQVLTEAGWSSVAFDYAKRASSNYGLILMFFVMCHVVIVLVLASVLKGIIWFVYITVTQLLEEEDRSQKNARNKKEDMKNKVEEFNDLEAGLKGPTLFKYDTVMKRTLFELKADSQILAQLSIHNKKSKISLKKAKSMNLRLYRQFESDQQLIRNEIQGKREFQSSQNNFLFTMLNGFQNTSSNVKLSDLEQVQQEDFDEHLKKLVNEFKINTTRFEYQLSADPLLLKHLTEKLIAPYLIEKEGDGGLGLEQFTDRRTIQFHVFTLHLLLDIRTDRRQQKTLIVQTLAQEGVIDECDGRQLLSQPVAEQAFRVDEDCIIRQMYLEDTNKNLIDKFEAEYFSDIFGPSFKETNKITIEPLIRLEATLTYAIKKLMRYPQISSLEFFKILSEIQTKIGSQLLKKGSLFKFVFQLSAEKDTWFTVHYTALNETRLSFLKHGVWLYHPNLEENEIYYAKDIFCTGKKLEKQDLLLKATLMKKLFETFQTLALTQGSSADFFDSNPSYHQYDAYLTHIDVSPLERLLPRELQISKIMAVMLTKEQERETPLDYPISDIEAKPPVDQIDFQLDETEADTFRKLSNLCALNQEEITANEGLPFAYVLNFLCEISDILKLYAPNFVHQAQAVLEQEVRRIQSQGIKEPVIDSVVEEIP